MSSSEPISGRDDVLTKAQDRVRQPADTSDVRNEEITLGELPGTRYRVVGEIARGGMGVVLRAVDGSFDRPLALKLLLRHRAGGLEERRFLEEARISGQLQHPGIPPVHEIGRLADGRPYFSMKLIEGHTLADHFAERATPQADLPRFLKIFEQIAQTLAYAHAQGVIHRDLKPANIMVGAFGEVQVMDWGLAKRLGGGDSGEKAEVAMSEPSPLPPGADAEVTAGISGLPLETQVTTLQTGPQADADRLTHAGQIMGTPAFMSPEQARGAIDALDERADVFGLGAILCVLLTGDPPYHGEYGDSVFRRAVQADLTEAFQRLGTCGADTELIDLCRECLKANASERPADAGQVALRIGTYLASVQQRLEEARVERVAAEIRAREEHKRRRLAVGLAITVLALLLGGSGVAVWYFADQAMRKTETLVRKTYLEGEVRGALDETERQRRQLHKRLQNGRQAAQLFSNPKEWQRQLETAQAAHKRAEVLAAGGRDMLAPELSARLAALGEQLQADEHDRRVAFELDRIRLESSALVDGQVRLQPAAPKLDQVIRNAGYDVRHGDLAEVAARIRQSTIRQSLVAALDFWALAVDDQKLRARLLEMARTADPDPWRDRFRQASVWQDKNKLKALASQVDCSLQTPQLLAALGRCLHSAGGDSLGLFRRALVHHPRDFWLYFELGLSSGNRVEQAGAFRAALATRPEAAVASYNLGVIQQADRQLDEAVACYRKAIELDPKHRAAHNNLGLVLGQQNKQAEAIACYRKAIENDPDYPLYHLNLGALLHGQRDLDGASACFRTALKLDPKNAPANNNLGAVLREQNQLDEAIRCFHKAVKINPEHAMAWCNLAHALRQQGKFKEALPAFQRGHKLGSRENGWSYPSAFWVLETQHWIALDQKLAAVLAGEDPPQEARGQLALAEFCMTHKKRYVTAVRLYTAAFAAEAKLADEFLAGRRYNAACAAARAANREGEGAGDLDEQAKHRLRKQALDWLAADLTAWTMWFEKNPRGAAALAKTLQHWQDDSDLNSVRREAALAKLPTEEQSAWRQFWDGVAALRERTGVKARKIQSPGG